MFVFGGRNSEDLNDLYSFDTETQIWKKHSFENGPTPRRRHSCAFVGRALFVFGGFDGNFFDDLYMLNVEPFQLPSPKCTYFEDLSSMVNNPDLSDFTFQLNGESIYAHKELLLYRFAGDSQDQYPLFFQKILKQSSEAVNLSERQRTPFLKLIEFLYCGTFVKPTTVNVLKETVQVAFAFDLRAIAQRIHSILKQARSQVERLIDSTDAE